MRGGTLLKPRREDDHKRSPRRTMKRHERNTVIFESLMWVNEMRKAHGLPPLDRLLPGRRRSWVNCPVARSIACGGPDTVTASTWLVTWQNEDEPVHVRPPVAVRNFIEAFDCYGEFDEFEMDFESVRG